MTRIVRTIRVRNYNELFGHLHKLAKKTEGEFVYRGQNNSTWQIQSAYYRFCQRAKIGTRDQERFYDIFLSSFFTECRRLDLFEIDPHERSIAKKYSSTEALAQHYGLPTRFVDWSLSPYVAAFFAFGGDDLELYAQRQRCSLFILDERKVLMGIKTSCRLSEHDAVRAIMSFASTSVPYTTRFSKFDTIENKRIRKQVGALYSVPFGYFCLEDYFIRNKFPEETLTKIVMPLQLRPRILKELRSMRISGGELYNAPEYVAIDTQHQLRRGFRSVLVAAS